jgi:hypothetical protein
MFFLGYILPDNELLAHCGLYSFDAPQRTHRRELTAENSCFYQATGELMSAFHFPFDVK